jgi:hypothetical protein
MEPPTSHKRTWGDFGALRIQSLAKWQFSPSNSPALYGYVGISPGMGRLLKTATKQEGYEAEIQLRRSTKVGGS